MNKFLLYFIILINCSISVISKNKRRWRNFPNATILGPTREQFCHLARTKVRFNQVSFEQKSGHGEKVRTGRTSETWAKNGFKNILIAFNSLMVSKFTWSWVTASMKSLLCLNFLPLQLKTQFWKASIFHSLFEKNTL